MCSGLDAPDRGEIMIDGRDVAQMTDVERGRLRNQRWDSSISFTICCQSSPHSTTLRCRFQFVGRR